MTQPALTMLLAQVLAVVLAVPLTSVAIRSRGRLLLVWAVVFLATSIAWVILSRRHGPAFSVIAETEITLAAGAIALGAIGALCRSTFADVMDAAAVSVTISLIASFGVLAGGPSIGNLPTSVLNAALLASPVVATASAAGIDILRGETLYFLSPIAHREFNYPAWYAAAALFGAVAAGATLMARVPGRFPGEPPHRIG